MKRGLALLYVAGLFLLGILIGALGMHLLYAQRFPGPPPGAWRGGPGHGGPFMAERLARQLELTPEQKRRIEAILAEAHRESEALRSELAPRVREQLERTRQRLREVLTPEQWTEFEELQRHHRRRAERFFLGPPHEPP